VISLESSFETTPVGRHQREGSLRSLPHTQPPAPATVIRTYERHSAGALHCLPGRCTAMELASSGAIRGRHCKLVGYVRGIEAVRVAVDVRSRKDLAGNGGADEAAI
jgi:hypothetical protein